MKITDYIALGFRNIWRRKSRSFLTIFAVVIGAISMVIMLSLVMGARDVATKQLESIDGLTLISVSANPQVQQSGDLLRADYSETDAILNDSHLAALRNVPNIIDATPLVGVWVKNMRLEGQDMKYRANIVAYTPGTRVLNIPVSAGRSLQAGDMDKIVVGMEVAKEYGYANNPSGLLGKKMILYTQEYVDWGPEPPRPPENADKDYYESMQRIPNEISVEIVGVVTNGPNEGQNYITLDFAKRLMTTRNWEFDDSSKQQMEEQRKALEIRLQSQYDAYLEQKRSEINEQLISGAIDLASSKYLLNDIKEEIGKNMSAQMNANFNQSQYLVLVKHDQLERNGYGSILVRVDKTENIESAGKSIQQLGFGVQTAKAMLEEIKKIFSMVGAIIGAIGGIVLFVAALGIINNMIMATYERTREIGILRACGATRRNIRNMFIFEAATLGFLGGIIGIALSFGLASILNTIGNSIAASEGVPITNIVSFQPVLIIGVLALTTIIGILAGLLPAMHAARMDPVEALRYE